MAICDVAFDNLAEEGLRLLKGHFHRPVKLNSPQAPSRSSCPTTRTPSRSLTSNLAFIYAF